MATKKIWLPQDIYQIKVTLRYTRPPIWRRLLVPAGLTLDALHDVLRLAMGWDDSHLHEFRIGPRRFGKPDPNDRLMGMDPKYQRRNGQWSLNKWETALPSRLHVMVPANIAEQIAAARKTYYRFGEFSDALDQIRARIEREPLERDQLRSLCWDLGMPGDFDVSQISWKPDYDPFFYQQLCRRARGLYLFREEYIFDLPRVVAVETPQLGHATYLFSKPQSIEAFLAAYVATTKEAIRQNRANVAERLGFLGRVVHGSNPRVWLRGLKARLGEAADSPQVASEGE